MSSKYLAAEAESLATLVGMTPSPSWSAFPLRALQERKDAGLRIAMISLYDAPSAMMCCEAGADVLLVGDSLGNVVLGFEGTVPVNLEDMRRHTGAVVRGVRASSRSDVPVVADMPFASYHGNAGDIVSAGATLMREGAQALKLEGSGEHTLKAVELLLEVGAPIVGHLGFTPQSSGRFKHITQGRDAGSAQAMLEASLRLEDAGATAIVLEAVDAGAAATITGRLSIPTIGIGAGAECDGQVLVWNDLTGLTLQPPPFAKPFANARQVLAQAAGDYVSAVHSRAFPEPRQS